MTITSQADRARDTILAEAEAEARRIRGQAEAEATRVLNDAHARDPQFFEFLRTLESYRSILDDRATVVLSASSPLLKLLVKGPAIDSTLRMRPPAIGCPSRHINTGRQEHGAAAMKKLLAQSSDRPGTRRRPVRRGRLVPGRSGRSRRGPPAWARSSNHPGDRACTGVPAGHRSIGSRPLRCRASIHDRTGRPAARRPGAVRGRSDDRRLQPAAHPGNHPVPRRATRRLRAPQRAGRAAADPAAEASLSRALARRGVDAVLRSDRRRIVDEVEADLQAARRPSPLGVTILGVSLTDARPPVEVAADFAAAQSAESQRDRRINEARTYEAVHLTGSRGTRRGDARSGPGRMPNG